MKVWIRADGNEQIGTGHVMRCLAIAEALEAAGGFSEDADRNYVNLAAKIKDGEQIYFPI